MRLELQVALYEFAQLIAVFVFHVYDLDPAATRADIAYDSREMDLAKSGAYFQLDGIANVEPFGRFEIRAAEADGFHARQACLRAVDVSAQRGFERHARVPSRVHIARVCLPR